MGRNVNTEISYVVECPFGQPSEISLSLLLLNPQKNARKTKENILRQSKVTITKNENKPTPISIMAYEANMMIHEKCNNMMI